MTADASLLDGLHQEIRHAGTPAAVRGQLDLDSISDGGHELHDGYVSMATANGVDANDPALRRCRLSSHEVTGE